MKSYPLEQLNEIAKYTLANLNSKIVLFYGNMGVGKTTLIKEICKELGVVEVANSPTFSLVNEYHTENNQTVFHFDFYRINDENEAYDIGIEEYFYSDAWCLIEWPENIKNLLPLDADEIYISLNSNNHRTIEINPSK